MGESLVPVERAVAVSGFPVATKGRGKTAVVGQAILKALQTATEEGGTPIAQTPLLKGVTGNGELKSKVLHKMAEDPDSPIIMEPGVRRFFTTLIPASHPTPTLIPIPFLPPPKGGNGMDIWKRFWNQRNRFWNRRINRSVRLRSITDHVGRMAEIRSCQPHHHLYTKWRQRICGPRISPVVPDSAG